MSNKELLNERILGLAGIKPMTSIGLSRNLPINEGISIDQFYNEVAKSEDPEEILRMAHNGKYGPEIERAIQDDYSETARDIGAHEDDDFEDIYGAMIHKIESSIDPIAQKNAGGRYGPMNESKKPLNERCLGISYPQTMGFTGNNPSLNEGGIPNDIKRELVGTFGKLNPNELDKLYRLYQEDPDYVMSGEVDDALFRDGDVGGYGQDMPDDAGHHGSFSDDEWEPEENFYMEERNPSLNEQTVKENIGVTRNSTKYKSHPKNLLSERMMGFAGITPLKPIGFVSSNAPTVDTSEFTKYINEDNDTLSKSDLFMKLPMLHSSVLMELAEKYVDSPTAKSWGYIVESLTDAYYSNTNVKDSVHEAIKQAGIL